MVVVVRCAAVGLGAMLLALFFCTRTNYDHAFDTFEWFYLFASVLMSVLLFASARLFGPR